MPLKPIRDFSPMARNDKVPRFINNKEGMKKREYNFYVYIMASPSGTLYVGMTNNIMRRVIEHKKGKNNGFSKKYSCNKFVYYEHYQYVHSAIEREKEIKKWRREKKEDLIKTLNPHWKDLYNELF
jgi:putative endonuclease